MHMHNGLICPRPHRLLTLLFLSIALFAIGCDDDPPKVDNTWWYSNSISKPESIERFGVTWVPASSGGEHNWIYYPEGVLAVVQTAKRFPPNTTVKIVVAGNTWTLLRDADTCKVEAPWESDFSQIWSVGEEADLDVFTDYYGAFLAVCIFVVVGVCVLMLMYCRKLIIEEQDKRIAFAADRTEALNKLEASLNDRQQKLQKWDQVAAEQAAKLDAWQKSEAAALARSRIETDEYHRRGMEMIRSAQQTLKSWPGHQKIGKYLRERHLQGAAFGDSIIVNFLADKTGFIRLKWEVALKRNEPPIVAVTRDEKLIRTDASFAGEHGDHIIPGHRYIYRFSVRDEKDRELGKPLILEIKTPKKNEWDAAPDESNDDEQERKIRARFKSKFNGIKVMEELRQTYTAQVVAMHYPAAIEEWLLDQIDSLIARLRDEE